jgi:hypothetical protein
VRVSGRLLGRCGSLGVVGWVFGGVGLVGLWVVFCVVGCF